MLQLLVLLLLKQRAYVLQQALEGPVAVEVQVHVNAAEVIGQ